MLNDYFQNTDIALLIGSAVDSCAIARNNIIGLRLHRRHLAHNIIDSPTFPPKCVKKNYHPTLENIFDKNASNVCVLLSF